MDELQLGSFEDMEGMKPRFWPGESRQASWRSWHDLVQEGQVELGTETLEKVFKEMDHWKQPCGARARGTFDVCQGNLCMEAGDTSGWAVGQRAGRAGQPCGARSHTWI